MVQDQSDSTAGRFAWPPDGEVPAAASDFYEANGYVVYTGFASKADTVRLRAAADELVRNPAKSPDAAIFTTDDQTRRMDDGYFLSSAAAVRCFREELTSNADADGGVAHTTNKIGHALHDLHPNFARFSYSSGVRAVARAHGLCRPMLVQSMYIFKQPRIGGAVRPHRDSTFLVSAPDTCMGLWWALEDSTLENGCLWAVPGSHKDKVTRRFLLNDQRNGTVFEGEESANYQCPHDYTPLPVGEGDLVVLHGALMHMSLDNKSPKSRHAYSIHIVDSAPYAEYSTRSWLQRPADMPFRHLDNPPLIE